ncbi:Hypothetical protein, putative [Bodo saltans]|uniref:Glycosyltransferase 61 catalytic domain-containing protein n=1 Tax=Bodo saltans TaxID=75058 RepID=A0A0S4JTT3_BODSA|nr:Hypothetical protein, putative [Bodo saltans]|eukprot:CUG94234.1 Hypothetical protein, putative [Bodo saltans]
MSKCLRTFVTTLLLVALVAQSNPAVYERHCSVMIQFAQQAAAAFNSGDNTAASHFIESVHKAYTAAVALFPDEPQAHLNMAVFLSNTHKYDEAIAKFELAKTKIGGNRQAEMQIQLGIRRAKFQKYSKFRDEAYQQGKGDIPQAYDWALKQLSVTMDPQRVNHDVATIEVMMCEYNETLCGKSVTHFKGAAYGCQGHYLQGRMPEGKRRMSCLHSHLCIGNFTKMKEFTRIEEIVELHRDFATTGEPNGVFLNYIGDGVTVHGPDGVLTFDEEGHCNIALTNPDVYTNIARSLPVKSPNGEKPFPEGPPSVTIDDGRHVLLLTQFSGAAFYHWMCEALPRLLAARTWLPNFDSYTLLVPAFPNGVVPRFIDATFQSLFPEITNERRGHRDVSYAKENAVAITYHSQPCPATTDSSSATEASSPSTHCSSLAHPALLSNARDALVKALPPIAAGEGTKKKPYVLVAGRDKDITMRNFDAEGLVAAIKQVATATHDVILFESSKQSLLESLALFHGAAVVVGVHGGALANIMACTETTSLVEIGFNTIGAQHYKHVAGALGMPYRRVRVNPDPLQRAIGSPEVTFDVSLVQDAVAASLKESSSPAVADRDEL